MSWLQDFLETVKESESPESFFYWSGLATLSAVVKNNVYLDRFHYQLYPNIYVMLIGKSGLRKGIPVNYAKQLVAEANNTRVISGRNSIEGMIMELSKGYTLPDGSVMRDAIGFMCASEFASFLLKNPEALTILTDLYDCHYNKEWKNTLKSSGVESLRNVCLTMLGASNEVHFKDAVPLNAIGGGFIARTMVVVEDEKRGINDLFDPPETFFDVKKLSPYLKELVKLRGQFKINDEAKKVGRKWYMELNVKKIQDHTGTIERLQDHTLKVAMLLSLSRNTDLIICKCDMEEAIESCQMCYLGTKRIAKGSGKAVTSAQTALLLDELVLRPNQEISRLKFLQKYWGELNYLDLDLVVETLVQAGAIKVLKQGKEVIYKMNKKVYESYVQFKGGTEE